ncbi:MAG: RMD1 family protein, partial [Arcobacteraceae bacterium]
MADTKKIISYAVCEKFNNNIYEILQQRYNATLQKDIIILTIKDDKHIIVFKYGVYVAWNIDFETIKFFEDFISDYMIEPLEQTLVENLEFSYGDMFRIHLDHLTLDNDEILLKVSISHAIAQSLKIENFENTIQSSIETNSMIPKELANTGKISLSKKEISKKMGEL